MERTVQTTRQAIEYQAPEPTSLHPISTDRLPLIAARPDPHGTRRRHAFWRNVVGPQIDGDHDRRRRPVACLID